MESPFSIGTPARCVFCQEELTSVKYWHINQEIAECPSCKIRYNLKNQQITSEHVSSYDQAFFDQMGQHPLMFGTDCARLKKFMGLESLSGKTVVDIGCGAGFFLDFVAEQGAKVIGVELNTAVHDSIRKRGHKIYTNIDELSLANPGKIDIAYLSHTLEHIIDPYKALSSIHSILSDNGVISITVPCLNSMTFWFERMLLSISPNSFWRIFSENHLNYFNEKSLKAAIEQAGFKNARIFPGTIGENLIRGALKSEALTKLAYRYMLQPALSLASLVKLTPNISIIAGKS
jgi:SAM-dependent methyltransferase